MSRGLALIKISGAENTNVHQSAIAAIQIPCLIILAKYRQVAESGKTGGSVML